MLFNSFIFLIYLAVILPIFYFLPKKYRNIHLIISSYIFYGYLDWRLGFLLATLTVVNFYTGKYIFQSPSESRKYLFLIASNVVNLGILGFFKYFNFFIDSFNVILSTFGANLDFLHLKIILPVGVSFYTFSAMSYTIDIYRKKFIPTNSFTDFALFISFFPKVVLGPIERAANLLPQFSKGLDPNKEQLKKGIELIITGYFKKVMIGDASGRIVDNIFAQPQYYSSNELLMGLILFSIQLYADFSGYSSIARGLAKILGVEIMKNFEQPYLSANITEFWRRWHISLSSWLRDYLYISLGGNRKGALRTYINLMITMLLGGLWHGANWTFVVWGGLHGLYLSVHKWFIKEKKVKDHRYQYNGLISLFSFATKVITTYLLVLLTWLFFRADSFGDAFYIINKFIFWENDELLARTMTISFCFFFAVILFDFFEFYTQSHNILSKIKTVPLRLGILTGLILITLTYMLVEKPMPFVYFQF